jgi:hypothetical protein
MATLRKNNGAAGQQQRPEPLCAEITGADRLGIWITLAGTPYFIAHEKSGWIRDPAVRGMLNMTMPNGFHLRWDSLDADIDCAVL